jgi:ribosomal protein S13
MTSQQMSITQALAELKLLRKRIDHVLDDARFITLKTKTRQLDVEGFNKTARASYQSFQDLLNRYNRIKAAIVVSNATALVAVAGKTYTVAEAVERKRSIETEKRCLYLMREQFTEVKDQYEAHQKAQQDRLDRLVMQEIGKDNKTSIEVVTQLSATFMESNKAEIVDPLSEGARGL